MSLPAVHAVFQPIVNLDTGEPVAFEALARGPAGSPLERPDRLFAEAERTGRLAELDWRCRAAALEAALAADLPHELGLFINVEPRAVGAAPPPELRALLREARGRLRVLFEVTERAVSARAAELLRFVREVREQGFGVVVDDVGADPHSLALMPFLRPDVVKLDLRLVQERATVAAAEIVNAVNAHAQQTGALVLAEGIETPEHRDLATAMGADLGQGWLFGRPAELPEAPAAPARPVMLLAAATGCGGATPYAIADRPCRRATKPLLVAISKQLELQALASGEPAVVLGTFQRGEFFTPATARRYQALAGSAALVAAIGERMPVTPAPGVRGADLPAHDALVAEWDLVVVGPHFAGALLARDLGDAGADHERRFDYVVTYDRAIVLAAGRRLLDRLPSQPAGRLAPAPARTLPGAARLDDALLARALGESVGGITIADARRRDQPLVYVNAAFERLTGYTSDEVLGRNCRFLQGPGTDPDAVRMMGELLRAGRTVNTRLLNYRRDGTCWWNEIRISPVTDPTGQVTHFIGVQDDVSARVEAEQKVAYLAYHDPLTGLGNRARLAEHLATECARAVRSGTAVALVCIDLDGFKQVNDTFGHPVGDDVLRETARRLRSVTRAGDLVARQGGDEFLIVAAGLPGDAAAARQAADGLAAKVRDALTAPASIDVVPVLPGAAVGVALCPLDARDPDALLSRADAAMYVEKARGRVPARRRA